VVLPASHAEVLAILEYCSNSHLAVVPFGGGTSVVGGLAPEAADFSATIALDLRRMAALVAVDRISMTATLQPGLRGPEAEALLAKEGLTLGHFPQSFEHASIGGFAATRSSGQASAGYGRFDGMVVGLTLATPIGSWTLGRSPANAAGPDLRQVALGSEGAFGVITELTVAVRTAPSSRRFVGWQLPNFEPGIDLLRGLAQADASPTVARLSDETETAIGLANATRTGERTTQQGCYLLLGFEGSSAQVAERSALTATYLAKSGAKELSADVGETWLEGRFHAPYLRDALLDIGGLVETVETATWWSNIPALYAAVRGAAARALAETPPMVLCHISHLYRTGASLYFTVICRQAADPIVQWSAAKRGISDAVMSAGGSITHHHAIGTNHRPWLHQEIGEVGVRVLTAIKREIDPSGILNPGVLVEPR
jgi:alkyldihydroxyacetonephosphate synthase